MGPPRSTVWKFFMKNGDGTATCKVCTKKLKTSGNTSNLKGHLDRMHRNVNAPAAVEMDTAVTATSSLGLLNIASLLGSNDTMMEAADDPPAVATELVSVLQPANLTVSQLDLEVPFGNNPTLGRDVRMSIAESSSNAQPRISQSFRNVSSFSEGGTKHNEITNAVLFMICKDNVPLSVVESQGFCTLMKTVAPLYKLPSRRTFGRLIDMKFDLLAGCFKDKLCRAEYVTLTTDIWTETMTTRGFLGITIHFLEGLVMKSSTIGVYELSERHNSEYISEKLSSACSEWNILPDKILAVVTDNGANMVKAATDTFSKNKHLRCFAHTLNLVADKVVRNYQDLANILEKIRKIITWFKHSVIGCDELRKLQKAAGRNEGNMKKLIQDCLTRWNSVYYMIERFIELSTYVSSILLRYPSAPTMLTATELGILREVLDLLRPLELVTKEISADSYVTCSKIIPLVHCMTDQITKVYPESEVATACKDLILQEISKRFGQIEHVQHLAMATLLDPRFKKIHFKDYNAGAKAVQYLKRVLSNSVDNEQRGDSETHFVSSSHCSVPTNDIWSHHHQLVMRSSMYLNQGSGNSMDSVNAEVSLYLNSPLSALDSNPFQVWAETTNVYPGISMLSKKYLQIIATSVPAERLFSKAGNIITEARNRLSGKRLHKLLFLNSLSKNDWFVQSPK